jgi:hypothetical protein
VTNEKVLQGIWCGIAFWMFASMTINALSWQHSFPSNVLNHEHVEQLNPISLFNITELGWFHTIGLVFLTATIRPRYCFVALITCASFGTYTAGAIALSVDLNPNSLLFRLCIYSMCCCCNLFCSNNCEVTERKAWYLRRDLALKLRVQKEKLQSEAHSKTEAERILVAYLCHEIRNPFNGMLL